jgi:methylmalonyl-CoA mutase cobalamin-binding subunit
MMDRTNRRPTRQKLSSEDIQGLARDVLNLARGNLNSETSRRIETASNWLESYCLSNKFDAPTAVNTLISRGVQADVIIDYCIPKIARIYGQEWSNDSLSFATVSVGCAHLQLVLKHIIHQRGFNILSGEGKCILLAVPAAEQHTLGALVLADQLRRLDFSVKMCLGRHAEDVTKNVFENKFHAVLFSASSLEAVEISAQSVNLIRQNYAYQPICFLGGSILSSCKCEDMPHVFDHVTNKLDVIVNSIEDASMSVSEDYRS